MTGESWGRSLQRRGDRTARRQRRCCAEREAQGVNCNGTSAMRIQRREVVQWRSTSGKQTLQTFDKKTTLFATEQWALRTKKNFFKLEAG